MLSATFIARGVDALRNPTTATDTARSTLGALSALPGPVGSRVPSNAETVARVNAAVQVAGGLLLAAGRAPRLTAAALAVTMVPETLAAQASPAEPDRRRAFLTNVSLLGGLIIAAADTAGKPSLAWRGRRAAQQVSAGVAAAVPGRARDNLDTHALAERGRELADTALERATELAQSAREHAPEVAEAARERATELAQVARERAPELAETARERSVALADLARSQLDQRRDR